MTPQRSNLVLIGMPGAGKSTVGVILAKQTGRAFVDTDVVIQVAQARTLQDIVDKDGYFALRHIEERALLGLSVRNHVVATGGSAAYSEPAMRHLKQDGVLIFLDVDLRTIEARVNDFSARGLAKRPDQTFSDLFEERFELYMKYADLVIKCSSMTQEQVCARISKELGAALTPSGNL
jgi:shikimate kinase